MKRIFNLELGVRNLAATAASAALQAVDLHFPFSIFHSPFLRARGVLAGIPGVNWSPDMLAGCGAAQARGARMGCVVALVLLALGMPARAVTYADWIASYPSLTGNATLSSADPDGDGVPNLLEYALDGGDPTVASGAMLPVLFTQLRNEDGSYNAPVAGRMPAISGAASAHLVLRFRKRAGVEGFRYVPETNAVNLNTWGWGDSAIAEWTDGDGFTWARTISDFKVWGRGFMRLRVEEL